MTFHAFARDLAAITNGRVIGDPAARATGFTVDSRAVREGDAFVALTAERDGHEFVPDAYARGATIAVVARAPHDVPVGRAAIVVADPLVALGAVARTARSQFDATTVVGIAGSSGKTSTKDLTAAAVGASRLVHASPESWNNEFGVPLTVLGAPSGVDVVVAELGERRPGDLRYVAGIAVPHVGVVTNVGLAHAEHLGGREGAESTFVEMLSELPSSGTAVLDADDAATPRLAAHTSAAVLTIGSDPRRGPDVLIERVTVDRDLRVAVTLRTPWGSATARPGLRGAHQARNAAFAIAVTGAMGDDVAAAAEALAGVEPASWRMEMHRRGGDLVVINDAYNANPASMAAALDALAHVEVDGRRIAVLGDMRELGAHSHDEHRALGERAARDRIDLLVAVGPEAATTATRARELGVDAVAVADADAALTAVRERLAAGDAVLVKGSRAVGLDAVAHALVRDSEREPDR